MLSHRTANDCVRIIRKWQHKHKLRDEIVEELFLNLQHTNGDQRFCTSMLCISREYQISKPTPDDPAQE